jgi:hypothetical protein
MRWHDVPHRPVLRKDFYANVSFDIQSNPLTFAGVTLLLAGIPAAACFVPAQRAAIRCIDGHPPRWLSWHHHPAVQCHTATIALAGECCQKGRRFPAQTREHVSTFGLFFHEEPTRVPTRLDEAVGPELADPFMDELSDREAGASGLLHIRRE